MAIHWAEEDPDELKAEQRKAILRRGRRDPYGVGIINPSMSPRQWLAFFLVLAVLMVIGLGLLFGLTEPSLLPHLLSHFSCGSCSVIPSLPR